MIDLMGQDVSRGTVTGEDERRADVVDLDPAHQAGLPHPEARAAQPASCDHPEPADAPQYGRA
jgi:hypothetical protein